VVFEQAFLAQTDDKTVVAGQPRRIDAGVHAQTEGDFFGAEFFVLGRGGEQSVGVEMGGQGEGQTESGEFCAHALGFSCGKLAFALGNKDRGGQTNADELIAGTDPLNANSRFAIETILATPTGTTLTWTRVVGRTYTVEARDDLSSGVWVPIATGLTNGSYTDSVISPSRKFYRIVVQ
jgi:hypothetical protein